MKDTTRTKFITDVDVKNTEVKVRRPFRLDQDNQRRFVRLEISSPVSLNKIKDIFGNFWPAGEGYTIEGDILNISATGLLVEIDQPLNEGDIVAMRFFLQGVETLDNVLGAVKRIERDEGRYLAGLEFIGRDYLLDKLSRGELEMLSENLSNFTQTVQDVLKKYTYREGVTRHEE